MEPFTGKVVFSQSFKKNKASAYMLQFYEQVKVCKLQLLM
jgi:hypothetical protein